MLNAEIITIGNEIIYGDILNTNSRYISSILKNIGINCRFHLTVKDDKEDISSALKTAEQRSDLIFITGGLGPTDDDITIECASSALGLDVEFRSDIFENIKDMFKKRNIEMPESNRKQAYVPQGAKVIPNKSGTAPMSIVEKKGKYFFFFPGVPSEVEYFFESHLKKLLSEMSSDKIISRMLKFHNLSEALMNEKLKPLEQNSEVEIAYLPSRGEARLKLTAKTNSYEKAKRLLDDCETRVLKLIGDYYYGRDEQEIEEILSDLLRKNHFTVATAESCTGGLISKYLTDVSGSSSYIKLDVVTYSNQAKEKILKVNSHTLSEKGAVSEEVAKQMAEGIKKLAETDYAISTTGIAGPTGGSEEKPVGLVYIGIAGKKNTYVLKKNYPSGLPRYEIRERAASDAMHFLRETILCEMKS